MVEEFIFFEIIELKWLCWVEGLLLSGALAPYGKL
jgi:hypothetical protein